MSVSFCLPHPVAVSAFMICRSVCACTEMLWMCVLYVSFGSKVRLRTFGCVAMGSALLFMQSQSPYNCKLQYRSYDMKTADFNRDLKIIDLERHLSGEHYLNGHVLF